MSDNRTMHFDMPVHKQPHGHLPAGRTKGVPQEPMRRDDRPRPIGAQSRTARLPFSPVTLALALVVILGIAYIALITTVMSYAALTVGFSQSVRDNEAVIAMLESRYLAAISDVTAVDYAAEGYEKPIRKTFVPKARPTAVR